MCEASKKKGKKRRNREIRKHSPAQKASFSAKKTSKKKETGHSPREEEPVKIVK